MRSLCPPRRCLRGCRAEAKRQETFRGLGLLGRIDAIGSDAQNVNGWAWRQRKWITGAKIRTSERQPRGLLIGGVLEVIDDVKLKLSGKRA
mmetsp:Transcript_21989/g.34623  ORF Transcript_21989/g.34623 Transcript_21989/m.34623 type:complete len:91 (-) Transcript_21989:927-1199(-)